jgi:hypothetical protein
MINTAQDAAAGSDPPAGPAHATPSAAPAWPVAGAYRQMREQARAALPPYGEANAVS